MRAVSTGTDALSDERLKITEIFHSLQGEATTVGCPTVFVRLTGCPLRCQYCDTAYAFHGGQWMSFEDILGQVGSFGARYVCVTGGEPLAQKRAPALMQKLCEAGYRVSVETSGAYDIAALDSRVQRVMDLKTPGSNESARNLWENIEHLRPQDAVKFVICSREDYDWAREACDTHGLSARCEVLFSPSFEEVKPADLAAWILQDKLDVRFQLQLHKVLWGDAQGV